MVQPVMDLPPWRSPTIHLVQPNERLGWDRRPKKSWFTQVSVSPELGSIRWSGEGGFCGDLWRSRKYWREEKEKEIGEGGEEREKEKEEVTPTIEDHSKVGEVVEREEEEKGWERERGELRRSSSTTTSDSCSSLTNFERKQYLLELLLKEIYQYRNRNPFPERETDGRNNNVDVSRLPNNINVSSVRGLVERLRYKGTCMSADLVSLLHEKDKLLSEQNSLSDTLTAALQALSQKRSEDNQLKFSVVPPRGDSGFEEWKAAMKMVARLPEGVPNHFRKTLWLTLAEKHLSSRNVNWPKTERILFNESSNPDDYELSSQIVKDLHRTGCSLFCGASGQHNQAVLKRVLLAYARWNKSVGYCQGLNMLAALILQVMVGSQGSTVKVMIYLIEGVLPESYFANNLRGLSVDMAVFRDLLRLKLPDLSKHLDQLQHDSKDSGSSYEPPLMDVFTMQWFLTIFSNCLPQGTVLRVWDLLFLEGNEILLRTALAIWQTLSDKMMAVRSADEFYCIMTVLAREMLEFGLMDPNNLIKAVDKLKITEVSELREKYVYNITPWRVASVARKGLRLLYQPSHDAYDSDDDGHHFSYNSDNTQRMSSPFSNHPDREKIALDISVLKKQYSKLRERQRQAHIIFTAACSNETTSSPALNHLLLGKSALLSIKNKRIQGIIPKPTKTSSKPKETRTITVSGETLHWKDTGNGRKKKHLRNSNINSCGDESMGLQKEDNDSSDSSPSTSPLPPSSPSSCPSSSSSSTELCDEDSSEPDNDEEIETEGGISLQEKWDPGVIEEGNTIEKDFIGKESSKEEEQEERKEKDNEELRREETHDVDEETGVNVCPVEKTEERNNEGGKERTLSTGSSSGNRRDSELALMQILAENSEILQRIQSQASLTRGGDSFKEESNSESSSEGENEEGIVKETLALENKTDGSDSSQTIWDSKIGFRSPILSTDEPNTTEDEEPSYSEPKTKIPGEGEDGGWPGEPEEIKEIRRRYREVKKVGGNHGNFNPFPIPRQTPKSSLAFKLGLYSPTKD